MQWLATVLFAGLVVVTWQWVDRTPVQHATPAASDQAIGATAAVPVDPAEQERCKVPDFAKAMGHESQWKLHNNCK